MYYFTYIYIYVYIYTYCLLPDLVDDQFAPLRYFLFLFVFDRSADSPAPFAEVRRLETEPGRVSLGERRARGEMNHEGVSHRCPF